jgi:hypothetical protein
MILMIKAREGIQSAHAILRHVGAHKVQKLAKMVEVPA